MKSILPLAVLALASLTFSVAADLVAQPPASRSAPRPSLQRFEFTEMHMAVNFRIVMYAPDEAAAKQAAGAAFARVKQIDGIMSDYDSGSELCRLSDTAPAAKGVAVSDDLWRVLVRARAKSEATDGAFDVTVGPLTRLWRRARRSGKLPPPDDLAAAREAVGYKNLDMDSAHHTVRLVKPNMSLDLGAIAKGYAADAALAVLRARRINRALVAGSGDISIGDPPPGKAGWIIAVAPLDATGPASRHLLVSNVGVSTSGDELQHAVIDGKRYSHVVNPHTGIALTVHSSTTIVGPDCTATDGMGTALGVMGPKAGIALVDRLPGMAAYVARQEGDKLAAYESHRFHDFEVPDASRAK
ncbi:MAG TPA: FAD:protein FMN transferase [Pirellulales bacterium]|jgi:thiamine biosynthesis lipoprotein|nr:FAD:protein FMN transferase [Pirellulales bacterium]